MADDLYRIDTFVREILAMRGNLKKGYEIFYRGNSRAGFPLEPKVFRNLGHRVYEDRLFGEIQVENPLDFFEDRSTLDKLVRMQHFSLPTRLLDITSNPLVALYFACSSEAHPEDEDQPGEVFILRIRRKFIKFGDSDTASCLANLARLTRSDRRELKSLADNLLAAKRSKEDRVTQFNDHTGRLLHFIKDEKPYFLPIIRPEDLLKVLCVKVKLNNVRIVQQAGAMLLFGLNTTIEREDDPSFQIERLTIPANAKADILRALDVLSIRKSTVYPYLENTAVQLSDLFNRASAKKLPSPRPGKRKNHKS